MERLWFNKGDQCVMEAALSGQQSSSPQFVEKFPRLLHTSKTGLVPERLNKRYIVLLKNNRHLIAGKRILDLASHDGRWSLAALDLGAAHVTGIEARAHLVENAHANCLAYRVDRHRFHFIQGEVFNTLRNSVLQQIDTVFCFGFFYHIAHHAELIASIDRLNPQAVIIDTAISPDTDCSMAWIREKVDEEPNAVADVYTRGGYALVGYPTRSAVDLLWSHFGYQVSELDWKPCFEDGLVGVDDYFFNKRASFLAIRPT
jgi:2-polyprenyl-3-methyl-5-hydroxy-6-metoxy-1,4-benzoquinol methylase